MRLGFPAVSLFIFLLIGTTLAQTNKNDIVLAKFDDQEITIGDFTSAYTQFKAGSGYAQNDTITYLRKFLDFYSGFKMRLQYAKDIGLTKDPSVVNIIQNHKDDLIYNYFIENYVTKPAIYKMYDRRNVEIRISHILFVPKEGMEKETRELANAVLDSLKNGADFKTMAERYSQDPNSNSKGGDLYFYTAGILPLKIENAIYNTPVGQIYPEVLKSRFGYHIFKVTDKRERRDKISCKQIMTKFEFDGVPDTARAMAIIDTVFNKLNAGENFDSLIEKYSMADNLAKNHGKLGLISRNMLKPPFDQELFSIKKIGDYTNVIKSPFGFHIFQLDSIATNPSFENDQSMLGKLFQTNQFNEAFELKIDSLKQANDFELNKEIVKDIDFRIDTSKNGFDINALPEKIKNSMLFSISGNETTVNDFINIVKNLSTEENQKITQLPFEEGVDRIAARLMIIKDSSKLEKKIPDFKNDMDQFIKNVLAKTVEKKEVDEKVIDDSAHLYKYYEENKENYKWPDRVAFTEIYSKSESEIKKFQTMIKNGVNFDSLCAHNTERPGYQKLAGHWYLRDRNATEMHRKAWTLNKVGEYSDIYPNFNGYSIIRLDKKDSARVKSFEEALPDLKDDYVNAETLTRLDELKKMLYERYKPELYYDRLAEVKE